MGITMEMYAADFRHKTIKRPFIIRLRFILITHIGVLLLSLLFFFRGQP